MSQLVKNQREPLVSPIGKEFSQETVINKIYLNQSNKFYQAVYLTSYEGHDGFARHQVIAYGRNDSFLLHSFNSSEVALYAFDQIIKTGQDIACECGDTNVTKIVEGFDQKYPYCFICYDNLKGFSWDAELEMR
jgi:hypothetical protein